MADPLHLVVNVIGWKPRPGDPPMLAPQFVNPVRVRVYTPQGVRSATAWLRLERGRVIAAVSLPERSSREAIAYRNVRCFCCTEREHEPQSRIERRRITSIDLRIA